MPRQDDKRVIVNCPQCGAAILWAHSNAYRPFCSERCKLIDLGQWASGSYRIAHADPDPGNANEKE